MKIAVSTVGENLEAAVDPRFGRAQNFLIYDTENGEFSIVPNQQNLQAMQGAGVQAGENVVNAGVQAVITGNIGPKASRVMQQAGIKVFVGLSGTVAEAIEALQEGKLVETQGPSKPGHWM